MEKSDQATLRRLCKSEPEEVLRALFKEEFWPLSLDTQEGYQRFEDDSPTGQVSVVFSPDGDGHIIILSDMPDPEELKLGYRFRTYFGGGQSPTVRKALLFLALAIKWDNEENPQNRGQV